MQYLYETHAHTSEGSLCGQNTGAEMARGAAEKGLAGIVITDHFLHGNTAVDRSLPWEQRMRAYCRGYENAREEGAKLGIDVLFGIEEGVGHGLEWLIYGLTPEWTIAHPNFCDLPHDEMAALIHEGGGLISHAHPYRQASYIDGLGVPEVGLVDAIEVFNFCNKDPEWNAKAKALADAHGLMYTSGTDTHRADMFGSAGMYFDRRIKSEREFVLALRDAKVKDVGNF